jgi:hypothetical protein
MMWLLPRPTPPLHHLSRQQGVSLSQSSCVSPVEDNEKTWSSIKHSILSAPIRRVLIENVKYLYIQYICYPLVIKSFDLIHNSARSQVVISIKVFFFTVSVYIVLYTYIIQYTYWEGSLTFTEKNPGHEIEFKHMVKNEEF